MDDTHALSYSVTAACCGVIRHILA